MTIKDLINVVDPEKDDLDAVLNIVDEDNNTNMTVRTCCNLVELFEDKKIRRLYAVGENVLGVELED